jgi:hypothetical protein
MPLLGAMVIYMQIDSCVDATIVVFTLVYITCQQGMEMLEGFQFFFQ